MSIWSRVAEFISRIASAGAGLFDSPDSLRRQADHQIRFTIAVIALGAKLAKADGQVTVDEIRVFRQVFRIDDSELKHAARVFNFARQSTVGYEHYARSVATMFSSNRELLRGVLEGLFQVAAADGNLTDAEQEFLHRTTRIFGFSEQVFDGILARYSPDEQENPYKVLGVDPEASPAEIRNRWRSLVRKNHPDVLVGKGLPHEAVRVAEKRLAAYNDAWAKIRAMHSH